MISDYDPEKPDTTDDASSWDMANLTETLIFRNYHEEKMLTVTYKVLPISNLGRPSKKGERRR